MKSLHRSRPILAAAAIAFALLPGCETSPRQPSGDGGTAPPPPPPAAGRTPNPVDVPPDGRGKASPSGGAGQTGTGNSPETRGSAGPGKETGSAAPTAAGAGLADVETGRKLYAKQCRMCHPANTADDEGLKGYFRRPAMKDGRPLTEENVRAVIANGAKGMPAYKSKLDEKEMDSLLGYMKTL